MLRNCYSTDNEFEENGEFKNDWAKKETKKNCTVPEKLAAVTSSIQLLLCSR